MNYHKIPNQSKVAEKNKLSLKERGLYSVISEFINIPNWEINLTHIAKEAGISLSTCRSLVSSIIKKGWLTREKVYAPNGIQGTIFVYKLTHPNIQSEMSQNVINESRDSKNNKYVNKKQANEIQINEIQIGEIQVAESKVNNNNYTNKNELNNTNSNNEVVSKYIWENLEEFEDFENFVLTKKSQELNKAKTQVQGIFKNIEKRINKNEATFSDLKLLKEWRQKSMSKPKSVSEPINDNLRTKIETAIKNGEIICDRTNSDGVYGVQISSFEFLSIDEWLESKNELPVNEKALELIRNFKNKYK